jgi:hypothetical protein
MPHPRDVARRRKQWREALRGITAAIRAQSYEQLREAALTAGKLNPGYPTTTAMREVHAAAKAGDWNEASAAMDRHYNPETFFGGTWK